MRSSLLISIWVFIQGLVCTIAQTGHEHAVVVLTSGNFEHATQAASGQTTGFWFVYFGKEGHGTDQQMWRAFAEQEREEKPWLLHAFADVENNPEVAQRFQIVSGPAFILFRNQKMYRFKSPFVTAITPEVVEALSKFSKDGWREVQAEVVPPDHLSGPGTSHSTLLGYVGIATLAAVVLAVVGNWIAAYFKAATPVRPPKLD